MSIFFQIISIFIAPNVTAVDEGFYGTIKTLGGAWDLKAT
jgi:hypothetical protein